MSLKIYSEKIEIDAACNALENVMMAAQLMLGKAAILVDGNPERKLVVELMSENDSLGGIKEEFLEKLREIEEFNKRSSQTARMDNFLYYKSILD